MHANSLFQTMFNMVNRGRKKAPLPVMLAHSVYDKCKSKELMTSMHHAEFSQSYYSKRRARNRLAGYALKKCSNDKLPLPSHLNKQSFTIAATDNFDKADRDTKSGKHGDHLSVVVLFQVDDRSLAPAKKEKVSDLVPLPPSGRNNELLDCQKLLPYCFNKKVAKKCPLPAAVKPVENPQYECDGREKILSLARNTNFHHNTTSDQHSQDEISLNMTTWLGTHALVSNCDAPLKTVGFAPIIPNPITQHQTVFTILRNLSSLADTLTQDTLPFVCDEGVYQYVIDIYCNNPDIFQNLFPMLGSFHMAKNAMRCAGKFLRGSGIEDGLIELEVFGEKIVEQALSGSHYYRSLFGLLAIENACNQLKMDAFWNSHDELLYGDAIGDLKDFQSSLIEKDPKSAKTNLKKLDQSKTFQKLLEDVEAFTDSCKQESEMCLYFENYIKILDNIKQLIRSDREANFLAHIDAVGKLCPIFTGADGVNYQRAASFYHELIKNCKTSHPELYKEFMQGNFVVKTSSGRFNSVAADMKLEQTIQRSSKSTKGIIGNVKSLGYTTEWCLIFHEVLAIKHAFETMVDYRDRSSENVVHHELSRSTIKEANIATQKIKNFIKDRENPYLLSVTSKKLRNISSQEIADSDVGIKHLHFLELSQQKFDKFRQEVYVLGSALLSDTIHQFQLLPVDHIHDTKRNDCKPKTDSIKDLRKTKKTFDILAQRLDSQRNAAKYDICPYNALFDGPNMAATPSKSNMLVELEAYLKETHWLEEVKASTLIVDFMSFVRGLNISHVTCPTFRILVVFLYNQIMAQTKKAHIFQAHIVLDSYEEKSLKSATREARSQSSMLIAKIDNHTPVPKQMKKFWSSSKNKEMFQNYCKQVFVSLAKENNQEIVISGMKVNSEQLPAIKVSQQGESSHITSLLCNIEEADQRLIKHIYWSAINGKESFIVRSNDTDVLVLLVHYYDNFKSAGVKKIWQMIGASEKRRFVPIHALHKRLLQPLREVLLACYIGTGCDYLSKLGTKLGALAAMPEMYLKDFGTKELDDQQIAKAEEYLVNVVKRNTGARTFDELRFNLISEQLDVMDLPPTSYSIVNGHIRRWWFLTKKLSSLLDDTDFSLDPNDHGWEVVDGHLLPQKHLLQVPEHLTKICGCQGSTNEKRCKSQRCSCKKKGLSCASFCSCQMNCTNVQK